MWGVQGSSGASWPPGSPPPRPCSGLCAVGASEGLGDTGQRTVPAPYGPEAHPGSFDTSPLLTPSRTFRASLPRGEGTRWGVARPGQFVLGRWTETLGL